MSDIPNAVRPAPFSDRSGKIFFHKPGHLIHICITDTCRLFCIGILLPQQGKLSRKILSQFFFQTYFQFPAPRIVHGRRTSQSVVVIVKMSVSELRLIREKSRDRLSEFLFVVRPMRFIHSLDLYLTGCFVHHINVIPVRSSVARQLRHINLPVSLGNLKRYALLRDHSRKIDPVFFVRKSVRAVLTNCIHTEHPVICKLFCRAVCRIMRHHFLHHIRLKRLRCLQIRFRDRDRFSAYSLILSACDTLTI